MNSSICYSRRNDLIEQSVGAEALLYDETRHKAYCLNPVSAIVWKLADGTRTVVQIAEAAAREMQHPVTDEIVLFALGELRRDGLLERDADLPHGNVSRRHLMKKLGLGAAVMMPVVTGVFAPKAAQAYAFATPRRNARQGGSSSSAPSDGQSGSSNDQE